MFENLLSKFVLKIMNVVWCDYSNQFNLSNVVELSVSFIRTDGVEVQIVKGRFSHEMSTFSKKSSNLVISRCCFAENGKEMYQNL